VHSQISLVVGVIGGLLLCGSVGTVGAADESSEVGYYKDACHRGDATACFELGYLYENGMGMKQNKRQALYYYKKACDLKYQFGCESYVRAKARQD
jgi:TPR repeat protein